MSESSKMFARRRKRDDLGHALTPQPSEARAAAQAALGRARAHRQERREGEALDELAVLIEKWPHDDTALAEAERLRADILVAARTRLEDLRGDLDKAEFFRASGALRAVQAELADLVARHGERHLPDLATAKALGERAAALLAEIEAQARAQRAQDLESMAAAFERSGEEELRDLVRGYLQRRLGK